MPNYEMISGPSECNPCCTSSPPGGGGGVGGDPGDGNGNIQYFCDYYMESRIGTPDINNRYYRGFGWVSVPKSDDDYTITILPDGAGQMGIQCGAHGKFFGVAGQTFLIGNDEYENGDTFVAPEDPVFDYVTGRIKNYSRFETSYVKICRDFSNSYSNLGAPRVVPTWSKIPGYNGFDPSAALPQAGQNATVVPNGGCAWNTRRMLQLIDSWEDDVAEPVREYKCFVNNVSQDRLTSKVAARILYEKSYVVEEDFPNWGKIRLDASQRQYNPGNFYWKTRPYGIPTYTAAPTASDGASLVNKVFPTIAGRFYYCNGSGAFNGYATSSGVVIYNQNGSLANLVYDPSNGFPMVGPSINDGDVFMARMNFVFANDETTTLTEVPLLPQGNIVIPGWPFASQSWLETCLSKLWILGAPQGNIFQWWCPPRNPPYLLYGDTSKLPTDSKPENIGNFDFSTIIGKWFNIYVKCGGVHTPNGTPVFTQFEKANDLGAFLIGILSNQPALFSFAGNRLLRPDEGQPVFGRQVNERYWRGPSAPIYKVRLSVPEHCVMPNGALPSNSTVTSIEELGDAESITAGDNEVVILHSQNLVLKYGTIGRPACGGADVNESLDGGGKAGYGNSLTWFGSTPYINGSVDWTNGTGTDESDLDSGTGTVDWEKLPPPTSQDIVAQYVSQPTALVLGVSSKLSVCEIIVGSYEREITFEIRRFIPGTPWDSLPTVGTISDLKMFNSVIYAGLLRAAPGNGSFIIRARNLAGTLGPGVQAAAGQVPTSTIKPKLTFVADGTRDLSAIYSNPTFTTFRNGVALDRDTTYGGNEIELRNAANQLLHKFATEDIDYGMGTADSVGTWRSHYTPRPEYLATFPNWIYDRRRVNGFPTISVNTILNNFTTPVVYGVPIPYARLKQTDYTPSNGDFRIKAGTYDIEW